MPAIRRSLDTARPPAVLVLLTLCVAGIATGPVAAEECLECHDLGEAGVAFADSVHGFMECANCHSGAVEFPHDEDALRADCSACHDDVVADYEGSIHGEGIAAGESMAPRCASCHGDLHTLAPLDDPASPVNPANLAETCGACHSDPELVAKFDIPIAKPLEAYEKSVHARRVAADGTGATCNDCHGSHAVYRAGDPRSMVNHRNVPETCGSCHAEITAVYLRSVHGKAAMHGVREAPVCTDCHGEHEILSPTTEESPVYASNVPRMTCGRCHGDLRVAEKYGIEATAVEAYSDSYHGLASRAGNVTVANCSSCHGVHDILPSSDPDSHINPAHLAETCGACHPGAGTNFQIGAVHVLATDREFPGIWWVRTIYLWMIVLTIGGMLAHNGLDLYRKARNGFTRPTAAPPGTPPRLVGGFRLAHALMMVSFAVLAYSGFALKYPDAFWARPLLFLEDEVSFRGWLHRAAAIVMLGSLAVHLAHLALDRRARACIAAMRPTLHDVHELRERLAWYLGLRAAPPKAPALGYPEKMEYLALMWGIVVMTITGFVLWFDDLALRLAPKWIGDIATAIHFYEAVLATLAIVVWHFYFVIFDPVVYPMDTAWLTGRAAPGRVAERSEEVVPTK